MRIFKEFLELTEKYYEPDDRLPSGETPVGKAVQKSRRRARTIGSQSSQNQDRWAKQYDLTQTKVKHGADNPSINSKVGHREKDEIEIDRDGNDMYLRHKPSSINFAVNKSDESQYDDVRTISWGHDKNKTQLSPKERVKLARTAKKVWSTHVSHRLPKGSIVHNTPVRSYDDRGREKPINRRSEIYKKSGFGELDNDGDQFAEVGREKSPKQKAKGKSRLKPLNPRRTKVEVEWGKDRDDENYDEWEDQMTFSDFMALCESSSPERGRRRLAPKGPLKNKYSLSRQNANTSDKAALKKAGFKRSPNKYHYPQENEVSSSDYHTTNVATYKHQSDYAKDSMPKKQPFSGKRKSYIVIPTAKRVLHARALRKQMGGDRTSKPVHDVSIGADDETISKNDQYNLIPRIKSFTGEVRAVPDTLKKAGAKPGYKVSATPQGVMPGENSKQGAKKRDKIYTRILGSKMNPKTGRTMGTVQG